MRSLRSLVQRARALAEGSLRVGVRQGSLRLSPHLAFQFSAWSLRSRIQKWPCSAVPSGRPGTRSWLTQPTTQWHKLVFSLKTLNRRTSVSNASAVAFHSILMKKKALWWLQQKWHRTLRKLKNFGNWYVRDFALIIKGYLIEIKGFYNCSIMFDKEVCLKCKWKFFFQSCTQMDFYLLWISRSYLGYGLLRLEDRLTD